MSDGCALPSTARMQTRARARAVGRSQGELGIEWIDSSSERFVRAIGCSSRPKIQILIIMIIFRKSETKYTVQNTKNLQRNLLDQKLSYPPPLLEVFKKIKRLGVTVTTNAFKTVLCNTTPLHLIKCCGAFLAHPGCFCT